MKFGGGKRENSAGSGYSPPPPPPPPRKSIRRTPLPVQPAAALPCQCREVLLVTGDSGGDRGVFFDLLRAWVRRCRSLFHSLSGESESGARPRRRPGRELFPVPPAPLTCRSVRGCECSREAPAGSSPLSPTPLLLADLSGAVSGAGRPNAGSEFGASGRGVRGRWDELLWVVVSFCRWLGGVERRG